MTRAMQTKETLKTKCVASSTVFPLMTSTEIELNLSSFWERKKKSVFAKERRVVTAIALTSVVHLSFRPSQKLFLLFPTRNYFCPPVINVFFFFFSFSSISKQLQKISVRSQENNRKKKQFDTILCVCNELDVRENQKRDLPRLHPSIQINNSLSFNFLYFFLYHTKLGC